MTFWPCGRRTDERVASRSGEHATEIFKLLTTDPTYAGLQINENYGLVILRHDQIAVGQRSAGAEQIVALSLLGALNRLATKRGPVIMDTPFGRLDRTHRANILRFVPTMADQVVLLVHDGEIDRVRDLKEIISRSMLSTGLSTLLHPQRIRP